MDNHRIYTTSVASVYPYYIAKAERKGRTKEEVDEIICWLTGYDQDGLEAELGKQTDFETFFSKAPQMNPLRHQIKGVICRVRVEDIKHPTMQAIRYLDKLVDELAKGRPMHKILRQEGRHKVSDIDEYNTRQVPGFKEVCELLRKQLDLGLSAAGKKVWHGHPVWFLDGNPIVGYSVQKPGVRLMFWSGRSFDEPELTGASKFKDASIFYNDPSEIDAEKLSRWLKKSEEIQWDYKNIVKRRGELVRLK